MPADYINEAETVMNSRKYYKIFGTIIVVLICAVTVFCMMNGLGLVDGLDFGAGAYYYADIPEFNKYVNGDHFTSNFPMWFHIVLFLV